MGGTGCMCGGTHVKNTSEIQGLTVTKIKKVASEFEKNDIIIIIIITISLRRIYEYHIL